MRKLARSCPQVSRPLGVASIASVDAEVTASLHHCITASLHHCITASLHLLREHAGGLTVADERPVGHERRGLLGCGSRGADGVAGLYTSPAAQRGITMPVDETCERLDADASSPAPPGKTPTQSNKHGTVALSHRKLRQFSNAMALA
jgi:hypothetical protein